MVAKKKQGHGVVIKTQGIADLVPDALPQKYVVFEDFSGHGGEDLLEKLEDPSHVHEEAIKAETLDEAFKAFKPSLKVKVPKASDPTEDQKNKLTFRELSDFDADSLVARIPDLRRLSEEEKGYRYLINFFGSKRGKEWLESMISDSSYLTSQKNLAEAVSNWLSGLRQQIDEQREEQ